tara:strand:- start:92 stop:367 length:276 start_codon:yes stop_codon:yes gene_type:complete
MKENVDYELIPCIVDDRWNVRILTGDFVETVIQFGTLSPNLKNGTINWTMHIIETPNDDISRDDPVFQETCGEILSCILANDSLQSKKKMI